MNDATSPEVEKLMSAFKEMSTVVKFANITLTSGNVDIAIDIYRGALFLFMPLGNDRGEGIVCNNLGSAYTLKAWDLVTKAVQIDDGEQAKLRLEEADENFSQAVDYFKVRRA